MVDQIKIEKLSPHLYQQFFSDVTKQSILRDYINNANVEERKIIEIEAEVAVEEEKLDKCKAMLAEANNYVNTSTVSLTPDLIDKLESRFSTTVTPSIESEPSISLEQKQSAITEPAATTISEAADIGAEDQDILNIPSLNEADDIFGISKPTNTIQTSAAMNQDETSKKSVEQPTQDQELVDEEDRRTFKP